MLSCDALKHLSSQYVALLYFMVGCSGWFLSSRREQNTNSRGARGCCVDQSPVLTVLLVLTPDQAQFGLQALSVGQQLTVVLQQLAVLLDESRRRLLLPLFLLQLRHQLLSRQREQHIVSVSTSSESL